MAIDLNLLWFVLIAILYAGYLFLEGFDFGVGILNKLIGRTESEHRQIINTIGPVWDANEVWLLTAGGATFAAFPNWYATMFSGFYLALFLLLAALIIRGVSFEFRGKVDSPLWRWIWDWGLFKGSLLAPLLVGVALANILKGVPISAAGEYTGTFFDLLSAPTILLGVATVLVFIYHGATFLMLKLSDKPLLARLFPVLKVTGLLSLIAGVTLIIVAATSTPLLTKPLAVIFMVISLSGFIFSLVSNFSKNHGRAMIGNSVAIVGATGSFFAALFPNVMISSLNPAWSLTIHNASSTPYTLTVMTVVTLTVLPVVLLYTVWTYRVFRKRVTSKDLEY